MVYKQYKEHNKKLLKKHERAVLQKKSEAFNRIAKICCLNYDDFAKIRLIEDVLNEADYQRVNYNKKYNNRLKSLSNQ